LEVGGKTESKQTVAVMVGYEKLFFGNGKKESITEYWDRKTTERIMAVLTKNGNLV
jgi:hypothetical protein